MAIHMKKLTMGILAHVDAGKTTLSESMLYLSGSINKIGRVDNGDAFLDTFALEKTRGITIFSKQAQLTIGHTDVTLLDTPGHVDFSTEMERALQVLDVAVLVISGADGVQGHTVTLWRLLNRYEIPTFLFINKMDQEGTHQEKLLSELQERLEEHCLDFTREMDSQEMQEELAMCDEELLERFLENEEGEAAKGSKIGIQEIRCLVGERKVFPCYFGSALKLSGIHALLAGLENYAPIPQYGKAFGAKIYKIARDEQGNRLTYMKITGGTLRVRDSLTGWGQTDGTVWEEKVTQIRIYSGAKYETYNEVEAGTVCAVTGLTRTYPGEALGEAEPSAVPLLEPILQYCVMLPPECDASRVLGQLKQLEEEEPELHILWEEKNQEIQVQLMGEVQIEVLKSLIWERFHLEVNFGAGRIVYKETIAGNHSSGVEGIGHFEPLRHYAEVHLLLEPGEPGSGMQYALNCSEDMLDKNWQRLILTHLEEKEHKGVLTGSTITDMRITVIGGRAHQKHTEGGDFRQATYRAVRQGLMQAENVLLEPYYEFSMELPTELLGRAMSDIEKRFGSFQTPEPGLEQSILKGIAPVSTMGNYQLTFTSYTRGRGRMQCRLHGYYPCHNTQEVLEELCYDPELDIANPTGSVFCSHGAGNMIPWYEVEKYAHVQTTFAEQRRKEQSVEDSEQDFRKRVGGTRYSTGRANAVLEGVTEEELQEIFNRTFHANGKKKHGNGFKKTIGTTVNTTPYTAEKDRKVQGGKKESEEEYLLVDGYNIIFAWEELSELAKENLHGARTKLMDILCGYQGYRKCHLILVFDAYRVEGHVAEITEYQNIHVVYTAHAETADQYIEKLAHEMGRKYHVTVATSDGLEQIIIRGQGCMLLSARDLRTEIEQQRVHLQETYMNKPRTERNYFLDHASDEVREALKEIQEK